MRILLAEHHSKLMSALQALITEKTGYVIAGEATDWAGLLEQAKRTQPDLVLLDWELPGRPGDDLRSGICTQDSCPRLIVLSTWSEVKEMALAAGADTVVSKGDSPDKLLDALKEVNHE